MATFRQFLMANRATLAEYLYPGESITGVIDDVMRVTKTERGAAIPHCDPRSLLDAIALAASWPVRIGTDAGAALVITDEIAKASGKPVVIAMLTARAKLGILARFGGLRWYNSRCVYSGEADTFRPKQGDDPRVENHDDLTHDPQRRGNLVGAYVVGLQKHGLPRVLETMNHVEIDQLRKKWSREFRDGDLEEMEHFAQYCMAKVIHRFADRLVGLSDQVRGWLSEVPPRRADVEGVEPVATITAPVSDPAAVIERAKSSEERLPTIGLPPRSSRTPLAAGVL